MYATRGDASSTRRGTDTRSGDRLPDQRHGHDSVTRATACDVVGNALDRALEATTGNALRGTGCDTEDVPSGTDATGSIYARRRRMVNPESVTLLDIRHADHRVRAQPCRAQALSMPAGPAAGGGGAQRRAWTATSTARDSLARWSAARTPRACGARGRRNCPGTNTRPQTAIQDTDSHGVNAPRRVAWGHPSGTAGGSFTPWLAYRTQDGCRSHGRHTAPPDRSS
jgi:hypothetical protein